MTHIRRIKKPGGGKGVHISIVISTRNREELLSKTIDAVAAQNYPQGKFELIIVDDGSDRDDIEGLVRLKGKILKNLRYFRQGPIGPTAGRNAGIRNATGQIIALLDNDCLPHPDWLLEITAPLEGKAAKAGGVIFTEGKIYTDSPRRLFANAPENLSGGKFITANMAFTKGSIVRAGGFEERLVFWREDSELFFRAMELGSWEFAPKAVVYHPLRKESPWIVLRHLFLQGSEWLCLLKHPQKHIRYLGMDIFMNLAKSAITYVSIALAWLGITIANPWVVAGAVLLKSGVDLLLLRRAGVSMLAPDDEGGIGELAAYMLLCWARDTMFPLFFAYGFFDGLGRLLKKPKGTVGL